MARLFGTDGVRGVANVELTPELAFKLGALRQLILEGKLLHRKSLLVVIRVYQVRCWKLL